MATYNTFLKNTVITINDILPQNDCNKYIDEIDQKTKICNFTSAGNFKNDKYIDNSLSKYFYEKIKETLDDELLNELRIIRANDIIMTGKYEANQEFSLHTDTGLYYNKKDKMRSKYTLLIYLNDDFSGGETVFYNDNFEPVIQIAPKKGMALLFDIDLWHKGNMVTNGKKYWIGCELISHLEF